MKATMLGGDWIERLRELPDESVHCCVCSPPYWGLRDYSTPPVAMGGAPNCKHDWNLETLNTEIGKGNWTQAVNGRGEVQGEVAEFREPIRTTSTVGFCARCGAWRGQLGLEPTPELFIEHLVAGFREVRRVLRKDGTLWLNMGDCYATGAGAVGECPGGGEQGARWRGDVDRLRHEKRGYRGTRDDSPKHAKKTRSTRDGSHAGKHTAIAAMGPMTQPNRMPLPGLKPKDLVMMPARVALALQTDGWWLRSDIIWAKPNPMPESVTDRPTKAHEYIFLLTKSERYYYDAEAIKEPLATEPHAPGNNLHPDKISGPNSRNGHSQWETSMDKVWGADGKRNKRSVWEIATSPFPEAHFATFPPKLVEPCILAGTSEHGCCAKCGAPWERILKGGSAESRVPAGWDTRPGSHTQLLGNYSEFNGKHLEADKQAAGRRILKNVKAAREDGGDHDNPFPPKRTVGWQPTCSCAMNPDDAADPIPCTVLDPFAGAGTTGLVALRYHRNFIGIELKPEYLAMARKRIEQDAPLFNTCAE